MAPTGAGTCLAVLTLSLIGRAHSHPLSGRPISISISEGRGSSQDSSITAQTTLLLSPGIEAVGSQTSLPLNNNTVSSPTLVIQTSKPEITPSNIFWPKVPIPETITLYPPQATPLLGSIEYPSNSTGKAPHFNPLWANSSSTGSEPARVNPTMLFGTKSPTPTPPEAGHDMFKDPIDTKPPPSMMKVRDDHPVPRKGIRTKGPVPTNNFFSNLFLGDQHSPVYTTPYTISWPGGNGSTSCWGIAVNHVDAAQRVFGKDKLPGGSSYYINPVGIESIVLSAKELGSNTKLSTDSVTRYSIRVNLAKDDKSPPAISFPLVQGMAYVTAEYTDVIPVIRSAVFFKTVVKITRDPKPNVSKFALTLDDGKVWRMYAHHTKGNELDLQVTNNGHAEARKPFTGVIQIVKDPMTPESEKVLDHGAGIFPETVELSGSTKGHVGEYRLRFRKAGHQIGDLYMYALPHHVESFSGETAGRVQSLKLQTPTKGVATLVRGDSWTMIESGLPIGMGFAPWHPDCGSLNNVSDEGKKHIKPHAIMDLTKFLTASADTGSMYFGGKTLMRDAMVVWASHELLGEKELAQAALGKVKAAFGVFASNQQSNPLVYDSSWGGIVSSASYATGDPGADFGNSYYNDHHFHYGYHILAAALIGALDREWAEQNKDYIYALARDIATPNADDPFFSPSRNFDWYHGHSWAHGLYPSTDGKNQESSSEDVMSIYALKMLGKVMGNKSLEDRSNLQLAIMKRSMCHYYLYTDDNQVQPSQFIKNRVAGILFENKVDHTTFFSPEVECVQGIHMIPLLASSLYVRQEPFVKTEWTTYFDEGRVDAIDNRPWKGIIYANRATVAGKEAWDYFTKDKMTSADLDGGASMTWNLINADLYRQCQEKHNETATA